jgi:hypothetical protein
MREQLWWTGVDIVRDRSNNAQKLGLIPVSRVVQLYTAYTPTITLAVAHDKSLLIFARELSESIVRAPSWRRSSTKGCLQIKMTVTNKILGLSTLPWRFPLHPKVCSGQRSQWL